MVDKRPVVSANVRRFTLFVETELAYNLLLDVWIRIGSDYLKY